MKIRILAVFFCICGLPLLTLAQGSVDGRWAGEVQGGRGPQMVTLTLKADGGKLTGSVAGGRGGEMAIEEGTFANNMLKFKTRQQGRGGDPVVLTWTGTLKGDEIAFSRMPEGGQAVEFTLKRQN